MKNKSLTLTASPGATKINSEAALLFIGAEAIAAGTKHGETKTVGPWNIIKSYQALAVTATWKPGPTYPQVDTYTLHGPRTMSNPRQSSYDLEGYISLEGKKRSAFTSSILFELPDGKLVDVAVIHVRSEAKKETEGLEE